MPLKIESKDINGLHVTTTQLPALRALNLLTRIGKIIAPILGSMPHVKSVKDLNTIALNAALGSLFAQLGEDEAARLARQILVATKVTVDGKFIELTTDNAINLVFDGRLGDLFSVIGFALEVNFAGFFPAKVGGGTDEPDALKADNE